jgi:DNA protecting protein DprA
MEILDLQKAKSELPNNAFFAENLFSQGYELIPITSPEYSKTLKQNLKVAHSPALLYVKGNKQLLHEKSIAIVGSRAAEGKSLAFTDNMAKLATKDLKVVVSGFAKGVDKQALDSAIKYKGQSIIVLPQGIETFNSGFKTYYKQIVAGDVLVLSTFHPKAVWSAGLAMARNPIIYGLADEIFVAESSEKGGTWSGVMDGLRKGRKIYVRKPEPNEKNANILLIQKGAIGVDYNGIENANVIYSEQSP